MAFKWLARLRKRSSVPPPTAPSAPPLPPPARTPPPPPRTPPPPPPPGTTEDVEPRVAFVMDDGTSVSPEDDPEWEERSRYYARNLIPGAGRSDKTGASDH